MNSIKKLKEILDDLFNFPRTFCAWIVFHLASWLDMRVIPNDEGEDIFEEIWEEVKDIDIEDIDED
jgi:hypothetical protein